MKAWTAPDLSVTITEEEADWAWGMFKTFNWDLLESLLTPGATETAGKPIDRDNHSLRLLIMANCALCHRLGPEKAQAEAERLMDNATFRFMVGQLLETYELFKDEM